MAAPAPAANLAQGAAAVLGGEIQQAEDGANAVAAGLPVPPGIVPGSRLSVIFNPGPIQQALFGLLERDDIL